MSRKLSVIMFDARYPPPVVGGKEKQAHLLATALRNLGVEAEALTFSYAAGDTSSLLVDGVPIHRVPAGRLGFARLVPWLIARRRRCRILHIHTPSRIGMLLGLVAKLVTYRVVFKLPNLGLVDRDGPYVNRLRRAVLRIFDGVVVLEEDTARKVRALGLRDEAVLEMNNGIDFAAQPAVTREEAAAACVRLVFVGRLVQQKRCSDVLEACARLKAGPVRWSLTVVGDGTLRESLQAQAAGLGLDERDVAFVGFRRDARDIIAQSDILVLASEIEGMPNVVLEAMSVSVPVVATDVGGVPRMLGEPGAPYLFAVGDVSRLSELLAALLADPAKRRAYGEALRRRCETHYHIDAVARAYIEAYARLQ